MAVSPAPGSDVYDEDDCSAAEWTSVSAAGRCCGDIGGVCAFCWHGLLLVLLLLLNDEASRLLLRTELLPLPPPRVAGDAERELWGDGDGELLALLLALLSLLLARR